MLKSTIPIANIRFFDDAPTLAALERRFSRFLRNLREQRENIGSQRGWGSAGPGKIVEAILREKCANPLMVVDEVEKAGAVNTEKGLRFSLNDGLLPLL